MPGLQCVGGHAVTPYSNLYHETPTIQFITILREPVERYVSQYQHWIEKKFLEIEFNKFLKLEEVRNFQTKKFAGENNLDKAIDMLNERFRLVGFVEAFDEFLVLLQRSFSGIGFDASYRKKNLAYKNIDVNPLIEKYRDQIVENNYNDIELYKYVKEELFPRYIRDYGETFEQDLLTFREANIAFYPPRVKRYFDYVFRKIYVEPISGFIRVLNGKPYKGSY